MKNEYNYEEIDLIDLLKILIKNKLLILTVTLLVTTISLGTIVFLKINKIDKFSQNFILNDKFLDPYYIEQSNLSFQHDNLQNLLLNDNIVNNIYQNKDFYKYISEETKEKKLDLYSIRSFISNAIKVEKVQDEKNGPKYYKVTTSINDKLLSQKIILFFLSLIHENKVKSVNDVINQQQTVTAEYSRNSKNNIIQSQAKLKNIMNQFPPKLLDNQPLTSLLAITDSALLQELENDTDLYKKYSNQSIGFKGLKSNLALNTYIIKLSSIYKVQEKNKYSIILISGILMGLFLGICSAFIRNFFVNIDWKKNNLTLQKKSIKENL